MGSHGAVYWFDRWAEYLTLCLSRNIRHCNIGRSEIQKVRVQMIPGQYWPAAFKVFLTNGLLASSQSQSPLNENIDHNLLKINYCYQSPSNIPLKKSDRDLVAQQFVVNAISWDSAFYADAWTLSTDDSIPKLLQQLAFRSVAQLLPAQLEHDGVGLSNEIDIQFYDGENFLSFPYSSIEADLKRQIKFYLGKKRVLNLAAKLCFSHEENQDWFKHLNN